MSDETQLTVSIIAAIAPTVAAVAAYVQAKKGHEAVNSKLDKWISTASSQAVTQERQDVERRVNRKSVRSRKKL